MKAEACQFDAVAARIAAALRRQFLEKGNGRVCGRYLEHVVLGRRQGGGATRAIRVGEIAGREQGDQRGGEARLADAPLPCLPKQDRRDCRQHRRNRNWSPGIVESTEVAGEPNHDGKCSDGDGRHDDTALNG